MVEGSEELDELLKKTGLICDFGELAQEIKQNGANTKIIVQKCFKIKIVIEITQSIETRMLDRNLRSEGVLKEILKKAFKHFKEKMNNKTLARAQNYE